MEAKSKKAEKKTNEPLTYSLRAHSWNVTYKNEHYLFNQFFGKDEKTPVQFIIVGIKKKSSKQLQPFLFRLIKSFNAIIEGQLDINVVYTYYDEQDRKQYVENITKFFKEVLQNGKNKENNLQNQSRRNTFIAECIHKIDGECRIVKSNPEHYCPAERSGNNCSDYASQYEMK